MILAIETSCDDTCAAVVAADGEMRSNVISSQGVHDRYGGVVPEVAARHHLALVNDVVDDALRSAGATLDDVDLVAPRSTTCRATSPPTSSATRSTRRSCA
jgi:N6-L-threonylcarbamoyladenine synthase